MRKKACWGREKFCELGVEVRLIFNEIQDIMIEEIDCIEAEDPVWMYLMLN